MAKTRVSVTIMLVGLLCAGVFSVYPLWITEKMQMYILLKWTPLGMRFEDVHNYVLMRSYIIVNISQNFGFVRRDSAKMPVIGKKNIEAVVGEYSLYLVSVAVVYSWGFDENGELIDVWVVKEGDAP